MGLIGLIRAYRTYCGSASTLPHKIVECVPKGWKSKLEPCLERLFWDHSITIEGQARSRSAELAIELDGQRRRRRRPRPSVNLSQLRHEIFIPYRLWRGCVYWTLDG